MIEVTVGEAAIVGLLYLAVLVWAFRRWWAIAVGGSPFLLVLGSATGSVPMLWTAVGVAAVGLVAMLYDLRKADPRGQRN